jgi:hypothetical protein
MKPWNKSRVVPLEFNEQTSSTATWSKRQKGHFADAVPILMRKSYETCFSPLVRLVANGLHYARFTHIRFT